MARMREWGHHPLPSYDVCGRCSRSGWSIASDRLEFCSGPEHRLAPPRGPDTLGRRWQPCLDCASWLPA